MDEIRPTIPDEPCGRHAGSFLVRVWREPSERAEGPVRCFVRDLKTGREESLGDVRDLIALLVATVGEEEGLSSTLPAEPTVV